MCLIDTSRRAKAYASSSSVVGLSRAETRSRPFARSPTDRVVACFSASVTTVPLRVCPKHRHSPSSGTYPTSRATRTRSTCRRWLSSNGCETLMASSSYASGFPWDCLSIRSGGRIVCRSNLVRAYDELVGFCENWLPDSFVLDGGQRKSARDVIVRELVCNCLIHREFVSPHIARITIDGEGPVTPEDPCE